MANRKRGAAIGGDATDGARRAIGLCDWRREEEDATVRAVRVAIGIPLLWHSCAGIESIRRLIVSRASQRRLRTSIRQVKKARGKFFRRKQDEGEFARTKKL